MKALLILLITMSAAYAQRNPQIRVCNNNDAHFWSLDVEQPRNDNIGFCKYDNSLIGSITLIKYFHYNTSTEAMTALLNGSRSCAAAGDMTVLGSDSEGGEFDVCYFSDSSVIIEESLSPEILVKCVMAGWREEDSTSISLCPYTLHILYYSFPFYT